MAEKKQKEELRLVNNADAALMVRVPIKAALDPRLSQGTPHWSLSSRSVGTYTADGLRALKKKPEYVWGSVTF